MMGNVIKTDFREDLIIGDVPSNSERMVVFFCISSSFIDTTTLLQALL